MNQPVDPTRSESARGRTPSYLEDPLTRFDARVLDPASAARLPDGERPSATAYVGDTLLITADSIEAARSLLQALDEAVKGADNLGLQRVSPDPFLESDDLEHDKRARLLRLAAARKLPLVFPVRFASNSDGPAPAIDVWPLLQAIRHSGNVGNDNAKSLSRAAGLNHLMSAAATIGGNPYMGGMAAIGGNPYMGGMATIGGNPYMGGMGTGVASYLAAGSGGHGPVSVVLPPPLKSSSTASPTVVVLDTGVGLHLWFDAEPVAVGLQYVDPSHPTPDWVGMDPTNPDVAASDPEGAGAVPDPMTGLLGSRAGHGTFIAGLLRQTCPDAAIIAVRVMDSDGVVPELMLTDSVTALAVVQTDGKPVIDAVVLSLGYYCEDGDDVNYTAALRPLLLALAAQGIAIFCAAGNDSTQHRCYPAAFADDPSFVDGQHLPMASVAALNPDSTVALFSNDGDWVNAEAPGANIVSTAPRTAQGAWNQDTLFEGPGGVARGTVDPDSFVAGFATWSGTSFAAPVLAGRYLARLAANNTERSIKARAKLVGIGRTPGTGPNGC